MKFDYLREPDFSDPRAQWKSRPMLTIALSYKGKSIKVLSLVDSGADACIFNASIGKDIGIPVSSGKKRMFLGIGGNPLPVYFHSVRFDIVGLDYPINMDVGFIDSKNVGGLLGQSGFFDNFEIKFEKAKKRFEVKPVS